MGVILLFCTISGWISQKLNISQVVSYLILGLLIGLEILDIIPSQFVQNSHLIINFSLSLIVVLIGLTLKYYSLNEYIKEIVYITLCMSLIKGRFASKVNSFEK